MTSIAIKLAEKERSYNIQLGGGFLDNVNKYLKTIKLPSKIVIITDENVKDISANTLLQSLQENNYPAKLFTFSAGEEAKNQETKAQLETLMFDAHCDRNTLILALGGGVVGDLAGFLAATYMRGINYLQIPTTLLAMVDSSIGGKVGINTPYGKNLIGAFYQPQSVIIDFSLLKTLPQEQMIAGSIEALKMFLTHNKEAVQFYEEHTEALLSFDEKVLSKLISTALRIKSSVIEEDEKESNYRKILNFGHTMGHAIERFKDYHIPHGYAVGYGILVEAKISQLLKVLSDTAYQRIKHLFNKIGISAEFFKTVDLIKLIELTKLDKKNIGGETHYILLKDIGRVYPEKNNLTHPVADEIVEKALLILKEE